MPEPTLRPLKRQDFDFWAAQHLLARAGFGGTPDQVLALSQMGLDDAVDFIVDYQSLPEPTVNAEFQSDLSDWSAASNRTFIWNYQTNLAQIWRNH